MPYVLRALFLLLLMGVGQADAALALACEPEAPAEHTHCAAQHADDRQPGSEQVAHDEAPAPGAPHEGASCAAMLSCGAAVALPGVPGLTVRTTQGAEARSNPLLPPPSRADAPGNPPPRV